MAISPLDVAPFGLAVAGELSASTEIESSEGEAYGTPGGQGETAEAVESAFMDTSRTGFGRVPAKFHRSRLASNTIFTCSEVEETLTNFRTYVNLAAQGQPRTGRGWGNQGPRRKASFLTRFLASPRPPADLRGCIAHADMLGCHSGRVGKTARGTKAYRQAWSSTT